jgi:hypothetical protein
VIKLQLGFPTYSRRHPQDCRRSSRSDKGRTIVLIQMFLDGGCDSSLMFPIFQVFLPAPEGGSYLVCSLGLERAFILLCFAGRGWYVDLLRVNGWSIHHSLDLYLRGCYNPYVLFLIFILPFWVDLHFMDKLVRFMSHSFLLCIFPFFLIIYL